jgi:glycine/D-amino acid oxidase-like deaminating enzyme
LHAYAGMHAKRSWKAEEGLNATHKLITEASRALNQSIVLSKGILRPAINIAQINNFQQTAQTYEDAEWWNKERCIQKIPPLHVIEGGLYIKTGLTLDVPGYLFGLWKACALLGSQFHQSALIKEKDLLRFDKIIFALGSAITLFKPLASLPIEPVKGQILQIKWPKDLQSLPHSLVSQGYLVMSKDQHSCIAGSTYEHCFKSPAPDLSLAKEQILKKISSFFPALAHPEIISCKAGIRATTPRNHHIPLIGRLGKKIWFITGLGSKGLLYHAWLGSLLSQATLSDDPSLIPKECWFPVE